MCICLLYGWVKMMTKKTIEVLQGRIGLINTKYQIIYRKTYQSQSICQLYYQKNCGKSVKWWEILLKIVLPKICNNIYSIIAELSSLALQLNYAPDYGKTCWVFQTMIMAPPLRLECTADKDTQPQTSVAGRWSNKRELPSSCWGKFYSWLSSRSW